MMLEISRCVIDIIQRAVLEAGPVEACGLVFGDGGCIDGVSVCANVAERPETAFEIDPSALIAAYRAGRDGGPQIAGCWHSHPSGDATPSVRDAESAEPNGWVWLIAGDGQVIAYRAVENGAIHDRFALLAIDIVPDA